MADELRQAQTNQSGPVEQSSAFGQSTASAGTADGMVSEMIERRCGRREHYEWGSLLPRFLSEQERRALYPGESEEKKELENTKALVHELDHVVNDVCSGFGAFCYIADLQAIQECGQVLLPGSEQYAEPVHVALEGLAVKASMFTSRYRIAYGKPSSGSNLSGKTATTEHVLEGSAMCEVYRSTVALLNSSRARVDPTWRKVLADELRRSIYPDKYWFMTDIIREVLTPDGCHPLKGNPLRTPIPEGELFLYKFLVEYSLSTPFAEGAIHLSEACPIDRFLRAAGSLIKKGWPLERVAADVMHGRPDKAYGMLDTECGFKNSTWESLEAWENVMKGIYDASQDPIAWMRWKALLYKRENLGELIRLGPTAPFAYGKLPLVYLGGQKLKYWGFNSPEIPFSQQGLLRRLGEYDNRRLQLEEIAGRLFTEVREHTCTIGVAET